MKTGVEKGGKQRDKDKRQRHGNRQIQLKEKSRIEENRDRGGKKVETGIMNKCKESRLYAIRKETKTW